MDKRYTTQELNDLVSQIEVEWNTHLTKSEPTATVAAPAAAAAAPAAAAPAAAAPAAAAPAAGAAPMNYSDEDKKELQSLYSGMTKAERETHLEALKKAEGTPDAAAQAAAAAAVAAAPAPTPAPADDVQKAEFAKLKEAHEALQKNFGDLITSMKTKFVKAPTAPKSKVVSSLAALSKSEGGEGGAKEMTDAKAKEILGRKAQDPNLKKSDRDLINAYCFREVGLDKVQHLLN